MIVPMELGSTATYRRRTALWVGGAGTGDGALVLTVYASGKLPVQKCYWVESQGDRVLVWESAGGVKKRPYTVSEKRCSCDGMWKHGSPPCKHFVAVKMLLENKMLATNPLYSGKE